MGDHGNRGPRKATGSKSWKPLKATGSHGKPREATGSHSHGRTFPKTIYKYNFIFTLRILARNSADEIADAFAEVVGDKAHFFKYRVTATGPKDKKAIIDNKALFVALKGLSDNLSFTQKEMVAGLMKLKEVKNFASLKSEHEKDWADVMAVKVRTSCRDLSQALAKNAKWTKEVFSQRKRPAAAMSGAAAARADTSDGEEIIGEDADGHADDGDGDKDIDEGIGDGDGGDGSDVEAEGGEEELPAEKSEAEEPCPAQPTDIGYICGFDKETNRAYKIPKAQLKHGR